MKCIYHKSDFDGLCSAAIVSGIFPDVELIGAGYKKDPDLTSIATGEKVFMVDYSLQPFEKMVALTKQCDLVWIDHHKTAMEDCETSGIAFKGLRRIGIGACALVWEYLMGPRSMPEAVRLLAQYDVFDHSDLLTLPFQYGMRTNKACKDPKNAIWKSLLKPKAISGIAESKVFNTILDSGHNVYEYVVQSNEGSAKALAFETTLDNLRLIAMNRADTGSLQFTSVWDAKKYDAMAIFTFQKSIWSVSLFTPQNSDVDVGAVAKAHGGGGHKGAAGFVCKTLPFLLPSDIEETRAEDNNSK